MTRPACADAQVDLGLYCICVQRALLGIAFSIIMIILLNTCMLGNFQLFCLLQTFFQNKPLKNLSGTLSECQTVWIQIRPDVMSDLIWVQIVCKDYQQTTTFAAGSQRVHVCSIFLWEIFVTMAIEQIICSQLFVLF